MSFVLFPALLLFLQKAPVFLGLSCLASYALTQFLVLLMLKLERLLCLCADTARFELTFDFPLQPLRIQRSESVPPWSFGLKLRPCQFLNRNS